MVTKEVERILSDKITREGFFNNGKYYYLGRNRNRDIAEKLGMNPKNEGEGQPRYRKRDSMQPCF